MCVSYVRFWNENVELWFQRESALHASIKICSTNAGYSLILFFLFFLFSFYLCLFLFQQVLHLMWQCVSCVSVPGKGCRSWGLWCQMCLFRCFWEVPTPLDTPTTLTMPSSSQSCAILHHNLCTVWIYFSNANLFTDGNPKELNVLVQITLTVMILFVLLRKHLRNQVGNSSTSAEECRR